VKPKVSCRYENEEEEDASNDQRNKGDKPAMPRVCAKPLTSHTLLFQIEEDPCCHDTNQVCCDTTVWLAICIIGISLVIEAESICAQIVVRDQVGCHDKLNDHYQKSHEPAYPPLSIENRRQENTYYEEEHVITKIPSPAHAHFVIIKWHKVHQIDEL